MPIKDTNSLDLDCREAIIYIPGIGGNGVIDQSLDSISQKIRSALDFRAKTAIAKFFIFEGQNEKYGNSKFSTPLRTIIRRSTNNEGPLIDVYEMQYSKTLTKNYANKNNITQAILLIRLLLSQLGNIFGFLFKSSGKSIGHKFQAIYLLLIFFLITSYLFFLIYTGAYTVLKTLELGEGNVVMEWPQTIVVLMSTIGVIFTPDLRAMLQTVSQEYAAASEYVSLDVRKSAIIGQFDALLEHILEKELESTYSKIHIISYSFGSLVALDSIFRYNYKPGARFERINSLVTLGCPFDLIRSLWPDYFQGRQGHLSQLEDWKWLNIYSSLDVLASNFRNDQSSEAPNIGISIFSKDENKLDIKPYENIIHDSRFRAQKLSLIDLLFLTGFKSHTSYFGDPGGETQSCFDNIIEAIFDNDHPLLS